MIPVRKNDIGTWNDHIIEMDRTTGNIIKEWDLRKVLDIDRYTIYTDSVDWFHPNSVWFDSNDNSLILSGRHQGVVKINDNNELVWILSPHKGWGKAGTEGTGF